MLGDVLAHQQQGAVRHRPGPISACAWSALSGGGLAHAPAGRGEREQQGDVQDERVPAGGQWMPVSGPANSGSVLICAIAGCR